MIPGSKRSMRHFVLLSLAAIILISVVVISLPLAAARIYGPPAQGLSFPQVLEYSGKILWDDGLITKPRNPSAAEQSFIVEQGERLPSFVNRLQQVGIIDDASILRDYLVYTGLDTSVQSGEYKLSAAMSIVDIAHKIQDASPSDVTFVVLSGWRIEEIAASLPTSGLNITPNEFISAATNTQGNYDYLVGATSTEGFLFPDSYILARQSTTRELLDALLRNFSLHLVVDMREGFDRQGLTVYQAVTLASIIQREAVRADEAPKIASVYLNRTRIGMRLEADPTVQYALGYNSKKLTWWTNPLNLDDLKIPSTYNTYLILGLPPTPIDNPGLNALRAVAFPADTPYFYFSARCDGSGYHDFAETFNEHLNNLCP